MHWRSQCIGGASALEEPVHWRSQCIGVASALEEPVHWRSQCIGEDQVTLLRVHAEPEVQSEGGGGGGLGGIWWPHPLTHPSFSIILGVNVHLLKCIFRMLATCPYMEALPWKHTEKYKVYICTFTPHCIANKILQWEGGVPSPPPPSSPSPGSAHPKVWKHCSVHTPFSQVPANGQVAHKKSLDAILAEDQDD